MHWRLPVQASGQAGPTFDATDAQEVARDGERYYAPVVKSARDARAAVLALPLDDEHKERALLVVSELTTNAIVHAGGVLYLQVFYYHGRVRVEVADTSPKPPGPVKVNLTSGRGLQMVEALSKAWGSELRPWGKVVWACLE
jgi:anti-sigma regulatory factor (Ser/Thr protein kinase)